MNITKDEARILHAALEDSMYEIAHNTPNPKDTIEALDKLSAKLHDGCNDTRRTGRTSMNSFQDCLKRIITKYKGNGHQD